MVSYQFRVSRFEVCGVTGAYYSYDGTNRRATVSLYRPAAPASLYEIRYSAKLRLASFNGNFVDLSSADRVSTDAYATSVPAFVGPDELVLENGTASFDGIWMQRAGEYTLRITIDKPSYIGGRAEFVSKPFLVLPEDPFCLHTYLLLT